ncbi:hypothetical protein F5X68DRAFT_257632 [Plectosphaerella plurivora]|uniref:Uncharacterized protein n=1 Tax=Plectosphaerella plurivora TaxID=936078 RepID=A0A9P8VPR5_9PEZI|nr:hypothetical protein F5X68DRAFT_257632 [Plectosphaerella plurivora]
MSEVATNANDTRYTICDFDNTGNHPDPMDEVESDNETDSDNDASSLIKSFISADGPVDDFITDNNPNADVKPDLEDDVNDDDDANSDGDASSLADSVLSAESVGESVTTASSAANPLIVEALSQYVLILMDQDDVVTICRTVLTGRQMSTRRFQRNFRRLLSGLGEDLVGEANKPEERVAGTWMRKRASYIAREFEERVNPELPQKLDLSSKIGKSHKVEEYLRTLHNPDSGKQDGGNDDDDEHDEDNDDDGDDDEDGDVEDIYDGPQTLDAVKRFVINSQAFVQFRAKLHTFIFPTFHSKLQDLINSYKHDSFSPKETGARHARS